MAPSNNKIKRRKSTDSIGDDDSIYSNSSRKKTRNNRKKKEKSVSEKQNQTGETGENVKDNSKASSSISEKVQAGSNGLHTCKFVDDGPSNNLDLILTVDKRRGLYECDYCHRDISQIPRIRCAVCPDFDLCLECFSLTDPSAADTGRSAAQAAVALSHDEIIKNEKAAKPIVSGKVAKKEASKKRKKGDADYVSQHQSSHGYRVADSTRFPLFPSMKSSNDKSDKERSVTDTKSTKSEKAGKSKAPSNPSNGKKITMEPIHKKSDPIIRETKQDGAEDKHKHIDHGNEKDRTDVDSLTNDPAKSNKLDSKSGANTSEILQKVEGNDLDKVKNEEIPDEVDEPSNKNKENSNEMNKKVEKIEKKEKEDYVENVKNAWTVEEDLRLLDAISTLGLGNWVDISEYVSGTNPSSTNATKSAKRCMERYLDDFLGRYGHIIPQYVLVEVDKEKTESEIATNKNANSDNSMHMKRKKSRRSDANTHSSLNAKQKRYRRIPTSSLEHYDDIWPEPHIPPIGVKRGDEVGRDAIVRTEKAYFNMLSNANSPEEAKKLHKEWVSKNKDSYLFHQSRKPVLPPRLEDVRLMKGSELAGYMPRRGDFDVEYENEAEEILADMEFSSNDHPSERALKLQIIHIYNSKLDERERRKNFLKDWDLLDYRKNQSKEQKLPPDERDLIRRMRLFSRFQTKEEHDKFLENLIKAQRLRKQIARLQFYRRIGMTSLVEAEAYELDKRRRDHHKVAVSQREAEERLLLLKDLNSSTAQGNPGGGTRLDRSRKRRKQVEDSKEEQNNKEIKDKMFNAGPISNVEQDEDKMKGAMDIFHMPEAVGIELLSNKEIGLCKRLRLLPKFYLEAKKQLIQKSFEAGILTANDAKKNVLVKIDVEKRDGVIDFIMKSGWIPTKPSKPA